MAAPAPHRHHRKLLEPPPTNATTDLPICPIQCNPVFNPTGLCSPDCTPFCPTFCHPIYSPTPSPITTPYTTVPPPDHHHNQPPLTLPLKISFGFLIVTFIYTVYKFYSVWCRSLPLRNPPPENQEPVNHDLNDVDDVVDHPIWYIRTTGLQQSVINGLTVVKFNKVDGTVESSDCSVCLTEFEEDDTLRLLPNCKHAFHVLCIDTWLRSHVNCPLCRAVIVNNTVDAEGGEEEGGGVVGEGDLGIGSGDEGEASGSSGLGIGESEEDDGNDNWGK